MGLTRSTLRILRVVALAVLAIVVSSLWSDGAFAERRVALIIGNSAYRNVAKLGNPANDAKLMAATLKKLGFEIVGGGAQLDLDKTQFDNVLQSFSDQVQGADVGLFYYAGHGVQVEGRNFLVPVEANPTKEADVFLQMIDTQIVLSQMQGAGTRLNIVLLDACRNSPFVARGLRAAGGGLAQMQAPEGTLISYATQPGNVALDGADGDSPYTKAVARTISMPGLGLFDAFNEVGLQVKRATGGAQQPWVSSSPIEGGFYFAGPPSNAPIPQPTAVLSKAQIAAPVEVASRTPEGDEKTSVAETKPPQSPVSESPVDACDQLAASPFDPDKPKEVAGAKFEEIDPAKATPACRAAVAERPTNARLLFNLSRSLTKSGDKEEALALLRRAADAGNPAAMNVLASAYQRGNGVARDPAEAARWYRRSAAAGHMGAMVELATAYEKGDGVPVDPAEAFRLRRTAAEAGNRLGMVELGRAYAAGIGVDKSPAEAVQWFRKAADGGLPMAMNRVGMAFENGFGVALDRAEAARWFHKAADLGNKAAMENLGKAYRDGLGVPKDQAEADRWSAKAKP
jgi:TPR repeat protein